MDVYQTAAIPAVAEGNPPSAPARDEPAPSSRPGLPILNPAASAWLGALGALGAMQFWLASQFIFGLHIRDARPVPAPPERPES